MAAWRSFWKLSWADRFLAMEAAATMMATRAGLFAFGFNRWRSFVSKFSSTENVLRSEGLSTAPNRSALAAANVARVAAAAARHLFFTPTCLERSIALSWLLRRRGFCAEVRIGARKSGGQFEAHAWVDCGGEVLDDFSDEHKSFHTFDTRAASLKRESR